MRAKRAGTTPGLAAALLVAALGTLRPSAGNAEGGNAARGERAFQRCFACHSIDPNEPAKLQGPNLSNIMGRPAAELPGFAYSQAMRTERAAGLVWDAATLDRYLADPESVVAGTAMSVPPVRDPQERADLVAFLARSGPYRP
jgi:cytochrome c